MLMKGGNEQASGYLSNNMFRELILIYVLELVLFFNSKKLVEIFIFFHAL